MGELSLVQKINTISYEVASAYTNAQRLIQQQKNLEEQISITKERIIVSQKKFDLGASGKTELLQAQIDLNSLLSSQAALSNEYKNALISLGLLLGRNPDQYPAVLDTILLANLEPLETMIVLGLNQKELKAERLPNLNLRTAYGYNRSQSNGGFSLFNQSYGPSASLNVVIPIYSGGRIKNILDQLDLQIKNQQLTNEQLELENRTMIDQLYNEVISAQSRIELAKSNLKLAKENLDISIGKARLQSITSLELRQAQFSLIEIQTQLLEDTYIAKTGQIKLNMLSGGSNW
jgi:outer membrane protein TolC